MFALPLLALLVGCGSDGSGTDANAMEDFGLVGTVEGTDAFVAILVADGEERDEALAYVCDGEEGVGEWFRGPIDDPASFTLGNDRGARLRVDVAEGTSSGQFTRVDGGVHPFTAVRAVGEAGLYEISGEEAQADELFAAWVVDNDGDERGAVWRAGRQFVRPTPSLSRSGLSLDTKRYPVSRFLVRDGFISMNGAVEMNGVVPPSR